MNGLWTKYLIALGQSLEAKWNRGFDTPETSDKLEQAPAKDGYFTDEDIDDED